MWASNLRLGAVSCHAVRGLLGRLRPAEAGAIRLVKIDGQRGMKRLACWLVQAANLPPRGQDPVSG